MAAVPRLKAKPANPTAIIGEQLAGRIGKRTYEMWFGQAATLVVAGSCVQVAANSAFAANWIGHNFRGELEFVARATLGDRARVDVRVTQSPETDTSDPIGPKRPPSVSTNRREGRTRAPLRRLSDFVVGPANRLAFTAARRIGNRDDDLATDGGSPLYLHGACGVGKTHLLQGATSAFRRSAGSTTRHARYLTAEQFTNEYVQAVRTATLDPFRRRMRRLDLLAVDDVQFLVNKKGTQAEFHHTIDALHLAGARVLVASNEHPHRIGFTAAVTSRLMAGTVAPIERPDRATRLVLLERLAARRGFRLAPAARDLIATRCPASVRELEGAFNKLSALRQLIPSTDQDEEVGVVLAEQVFADGGWRPRAPLHVDVIIEAVCRRLMVDRAQLLGSGRHRRVVMARSVIALLGRELTTHSYPELATALGRKHHSTVHTAVGRMQRKLEANEDAEVGSGGQSIPLHDLLDQLRQQILSASRR